METGNGVIGRDTVTGGMINNSMLKFNYLTKIEKFLYDMFEC